MAEQMVTWWYPVDGYSRGAPSPEYQAMMDMESGWIEPMLQAAGFEKVNWMDRESDISLSFSTYRHTKTGDRFFELWNDAECLSSVHVLSDNVDAFMMTEYLRIRQQIAMANGADDTHLIKQALISFIRFGHGTDTISQYGETRDEARLAAIAERARQERQTQKTT